MRRWFLFVVLRGVLLCLICDTGSIGVASAQNNSDDVSEVDHHSPPITNFIERSLVTESDAIPDTANGPTSNATLPSSPMGSEITGHSRGASSFSPSFGALLQRPREKASRKLVKDKKSQKKKHEKNGKKSEGKGMDKEKTSQRRVPTNPPSRQPSRRQSIASHLSSVPSAETVADTIVAAPTVEILMSPTGIPGTNIETGNPLSFIATDAPSHGALTTNEPTADAPSPGATNTATVSPSMDGGVLRLSIPSFFIAVVSDGATVSPTDEAFERILNASDIYFTGVLAEAYRSRNDTIDFIDLDLELNNTGFNLGFPEERYNLYMDFVASSTFTNFTSPPQAQDVFDIVKESINVAYILDVLRSVNGTAFEQATEVYYGSAVKIF